MRPMKPRPPGSASDALSRMIGEIAESQGREPAAGADIAADFEDISASMIRKATDPDLPEDLGFRRVARLTEHFGARAAAEHLAICAGGIFIPLPDGDAEGRWPDATAIAAREFGEATAAIINAFAHEGPGGRKITTREAQRVVREIDDVVRVLAELRGLAMDAAKRKPG